MEVWARVLRGGTVSAQTGDGAPSLQPARKCDAAHSQHECGRAESSAHSSSPDGPARLRGMSAAQWVSRGGLGRGWSGRCIWAGRVKKGGVGILFGMRRLGSRRGRGADPQAGTKDGGHPGGRTGIWGVRGLSGSPWNTQEKGPGGGRAGQGRSTNCHRRPRRGSPPVHNYPRRRTDSNG